jgi:proteasome lid subunit RPN8/RPN11
VLHLSPELHNQIARHGETGYPDEICGFLVGVENGESKTVTRIVAVENNWDETGQSEFAQAGADFSQASRRRRFFLPADEYYQADKEARQKGETILGFYHSHPDHVAEPSVYDLRLAREIFPGYSYIIVSVQHGKAGALRSFVLRDDGLQFDEEVVTAD